MLKKPAGVIGLVLLLAIVASAIGQTLLNETQRVESRQVIPTRGMTMEYVEATFGNPMNRRSAVGDPPITRWEYPGFVVYFEYKRVIHSVARREQPQ